MVVPGVQGLDEGGRGWVLHDVRSGREEEVQDMMVRLFWLLVGLAIGLREKRRQR